MEPKAFIDNFVNIVTKKYFCFEGKADRREFWQFFLVCVVISFVLGLIPVVKYLGWLLDLALLCPALGVGARRLHDTGRTGWLQLIALIPFIGIIVLIVFWAQAGTSDAPAAAEEPKA